MKRTRLRCALTAAVALCIVLSAPVALAGPLTFAFEFDEYEGFDTNSTVTGQLTIDSGTLASILADPNDDGFPISDLESLTITVSGSSAGDGTYGLSDFTSFDWWSAGATFDFSRNLVGQPTTEYDPGAPWGFVDDGCCGDFTFFSSPGSPTAPNAPYYFLLATNGTGDPSDYDELEYLQEVPEPAAAGLFVPGGLAMLAIVLRRREMAAV